MPPVNPRPRAQDHQLAAGSPHRINFSWLLKLRWGAIAGQLVTIAGVHAGMGISLPLGPLLLIVAFEAASNLAGVLWLRRRAEIGEVDLALLLALDVVLLTGLLFFTGGASNPFSFLYLVHLALAAVVLRTAWTWALVALALVCSGGLFFGHVWLDLTPAAGDHAHHMQTHLDGMWVAFGVAATFIVYFVTRIQRALAQRESDLAAERAAAIRNERLASLATLAAGAAHELATPLGTIAVVGRELERAAVRAEPIALDDVRLIRAEVDRCRQILDQMSADAGQGTGEAPIATSLISTLTACLAGLPRDPIIELHPGDRPELKVKAPPRALGQAVTAVMKNAQEASPAGSTVKVSTRVVDPNDVEVLIEDAGTGITSADLARLGEPFFSTKPPGRGMGLGLFLTRTVLERIGGRLEIQSRPGAGTRVCLRLPLAREGQATS